MPLKGRKPETKDERLKIFLYGPAGGGKTLAALQFPNAYIIDTEKGTSRYGKLINEKNSEVLETTDPFIIEEEIESLINENHRFTTLIIDPITTYWQQIQSLWNEKFVQAQIKLRRENLLEDFGLRYWDKVKKQYKKLITRLMDLDMNVIITAHQKDKWGPGQSIVGITSDSEKNDEHTFDFVFRILRRDDKYIAVTDKQRILPGDKRFPDEFDWNYENLIKFYNKNAIEKPTIYASEKTNMATVETDIKPLTQKALPWETENDTQIEDKKTTTFDTASEQNASPEAVKLNFLLKNLEKELISETDFVNFVTNVIFWENINSLNDITLEQLSILLENWSEKIIPKYRAAKKQSASPKNEENKKEKKEKTPLDLLQKKLKENNIFHKDFRRFVREIVGWTGIKFISNLSNEQINTLLNNWDERVLPKYKRFIGAGKELDPALFPPIVTTNVGALVVPNKESDTNQAGQEVFNQTVEQAKEVVGDLPLEPNKPIRANQITKIKNFLVEQKIDITEFLQSFGITKWDEITQEGANNIINNFDAVVAELKS